MLNMSSFLKNVSADNTVIVNGAKFMVSDETAVKIMEIITGHNAPATLTTPTETPENPETAKRDYHHMSPAKDTVLALTWKDKNHVHVDTYMVPACKVAFAKTYSATYDKTAKVYTVAKTTREFNSRVKAVTIPASAIETERQNFAKKSVERAKKLAK
jgi:hypothetical protein